MYLNHLVFEIVMIPIARLCELQIHLLSLHYVTAMECGKNAHDARFSAYVVQIQSG